MIINNYDIKSSLKLFKEPMSYGLAIQALSKHFGRKPNTVEHGIWQQVKPLLTYDEYAQGYFFKEKI